MPADAPVGVVPAEKWLPLPNALGLLPPWPPDPSLMTGRKNAPDWEMTCGSAVRAKAPMATTTTAVAIAAAGRSHA
jgi:hypothetical protein